MRRDIARYDAEKLRSERQCYNTKLDHAIIEEKKAEARLGTATNPVERREFERQYESASNLRHDYQVYVGLLDEAAPSHNVTSTPSVDIAPPEPVDVAPPVGPARKKGYTSPLKKIVSLILLDMPKVGSESTMKEIADYIDDTSSLLSEEVVGLLGYKGRSVRDAIDNDKLAMSRLTDAVNKVRSDTKKAKS